MDNVSSDMEETKRERKSKKKTGAMLSALTSMVLDQQRTSAEKLPTK